MQRRQTLFSTAILRIRLVTPNSIYTCAPGATGEEDAWMIVSFQKVKVPNNEGRQDSPQSLGKVMETVGVHAVL